MNRIKALIFSLTLSVASILALPQAVVAAGTASMSLSPKSASLNIGSTFSVTVVENSGASAVNGVDAVLSYDSSKIQVIGKSCGGAFEIAAPSGLGSLTCATVTPKSGTQTVGTFSLKVVAGGSGVVGFQPNSQITASDGQGTNVWNSVSNGANYSFIAPAPAPKPKATVAQTPAQSTDAAPAPVAKEVKVKDDNKKVTPVATTKPASASKKNDVSRKVWSAVLLAIVLFAAALIFIDSFRQKAAAVVSSAQSRITGGEAAAVTTASTTKSGGKKSASKKSKK